MCGSVIEYNQKSSFSRLDNARKYAESAKNSTMRDRAFFKNIQSLDIQGRCLEVGAGPGILMSEIARRSPEVDITAVEVSQFMVTVGRDCVSANNLEDRITFVVGDVQDKPLFRSLGEFDFVYSAYALHHWPDLTRAIVNVTNAVAKGGILYLYDLRRVWWRYRIPSKMDFSAQSEHHICPMK